MYSTKNPQRKWIYWRKRMNKCAKKYGLHRLPHWESVSPGELCVVSVFWHVRKIKWAICMEYIYIYRHIGRCQSTRSTLKTMPNTRAIKIEATHFDCVRECGTTTRENLLPQPTKPLLRKGNCRRMERNRHVLYKTIRCSIWFIALWSENSFSAVVVVVLPHRPLWAQHYIYFSIRLRLKREK